MAVKVKGGMTKGGRIALRLSNHESNPHEEVADQRKLWRSTEQRGKGVHGQRRQTLRIFRGLVAN